MNPAMNTEMAAQACDLCGSKDRVVIGRIGRDFRRLVSVVCRNCGLMRQEPVPTEAQLRDYYARNYRLSYKGSAEPRQRDLARAVQRGEAAPLPFSLVAGFTVGGAALALMTVVLVLAQ